MTVATAGPWLRGLWLAAVGLLVAVAGAGMTFAYRRPRLVAIPSFIEVIDGLGVSERLAMLISFILPILSSLVLVVIVWRGRRHDAMALLFSLALLGIFVFSSGSSHAVRTTVPSAWPLALAADLVALEALAFLFYLFPNGRLEPRWARLVLIPCAVVVAAYPPIAPAVRRLAIDPEAVGSVLTTVTLVVTTALIGGAAAAQTVRYRRLASPVERLQMRWVLLGLSVIVLPVTLVMVGTNLFPGEWLGWVLLGAALFSPLVPICAGVAIFRYRLYEIDQVVRRTAVYAVLSGFLALIYSGLVVTISQLGAFGNDLAVAGATLVVAALFSPARRRIQRFVDRRFNRAAYDPDATLEAFATRLRHEIDPKVLEAELISVVTTSLQPSSTGLWVRNH